MALRWRLMGYIVHATKPPEPKPRFISMKSVCDFAAEKSDSWRSFCVIYGGRIRRRIPSSGMGCPLANRITSERRHEYSRNWK